MKTQQSNQHRPVQVRRSRRWSGLYTYTVNCTGLFRAITERIVLANDSADDVALRIARERNPGMLSYTTADVKQFGGGY